MQQYDKTVCAVGVKMEWKDTPVSTQSAILKDMERD